MIRRGLNKVEGLPQLLGRLKALRPTAGDAAQRGLVLAAEHLKGKSQEVVPVDTGVLRESAYVRVADRSTRGTMLPKGYDSIVEVGYSAPYAHYVHENLEMRHQPGKIAKYLEIPAQQEAGAMRRILSDATRGEYQKKAVEALSRVRGFFSGLVNRVRGLS